MVFPKYNVLPGWRSAYARDPSESRFPSLWEGLMGLWVPAMGPTGTKWVDVSGKKNNFIFGASLTGADWAVNAQGPYTQFNRVDSDYVDSERIIDFSGLVGMTAIWRFEWTGAATAEHILGDCKQVDNLSAGWVVRLEPATDRAEVFVSIAGDTFISANLFAGDFTANVPHHFVLRLNTLDGLRGILDGVVSPSTAMPAPLHPTATTLNLRVGGAPTGNIDLLEGKVHSFALYNRSLTLPELYEDYKHPYAPLLLKSDIFGNAVVAGNRTQVVLI